VLCRSSTVPDVEVAVAGLLQSCRSPPGRRLPWPPDAPAPLAAGWPPRLPGRAPPAARLRLPPRTRGRARPRAARPPPPTTGRLPFQPPPQTEREGVD
jgi:hypothetical protein